MRLTLTITPDVTATSKLGALAPPELPALSDQVMLQKGQSLSCWQGIFNGRLSGTTGVAASRRTALLENTLKHDRRNAI